MCADPERVTTRAVSAPHCSDNPELRKLRDRVAVVGQVWPGQDVHESVIGAVPGVVLQANYIESLLDQRIFKPLDPWLQLLIGAVWLLLIAAPAFLWGEQPLMAVPLCLVAAIAPAWFMEAIVVARLHYYTELLFPSMAVVVLFIVDRLFDKIMEKMAAREPLGRGPQAAPQDKPRIREDL
jgi:CHASE2 domain-containing sensor protein